MGSGASRSSGLVTLRIVVVATRVSSAVVSSLAWPSSTWMTRMSVSCSSRCVAKLCRSVCGDTRFLIPAASAAAWTAVELTGRERLDRVAARKQPAPRQQYAAAPAFHPPITQQLKQLQRQHGVAVFASFALLNPQQHALGVDIADLERDHLGDAQPGAVGGSECRLVLGPGRRLEEKRNLLHAQNGR